MVTSFSCHHYTFINLNNIFDSTFANALLLVFQNCEYFPKTPSAAAKSGVKVKSAILLLESSQVQVVHIEKMVFCNGVNIWQKNTLFFPAQ